ncbi:nuclease Le1 [Dentipellis sp. KUC8613]|nr:nuclease Le1 [Dentipellis sp. KUC8613]
MKSGLQLACVLASLALPKYASAWGNLGHETIGYIAMEFIGSKTLSFVQSSLGSTYNFSLGPAATWADSVRSEAAYKFSAPFHFIDAEDSPPDSCSVNQARDCGDEGCILTAIQNYTARVQETSLNAQQRQEALKFISDSRTFMADIDTPSPDLRLQFVGDIGQPLHVEAFEVGGNDISAKCDGKSTNLHAAWDTGMLEKNLDANFNGDPQVWAAALTKEIKSGSYESLSDGWVSCIKSSALSSTSCPLVWAKESNSFDCSDVFSYTTGEDLCDSAYYTAAIPIIEEQIAKQGFRLAKWLDTIFE